MLLRGFRISAMLAAVALFVGCQAAPSEPAPTPRMGEACQLRGCACVGKGIPFFGGRDSAKVQWRRNGDAFCPDGFELTFTD